MSDEEGTTLKNVTDSPRGVFGVVRRIENAAADLGDGWKVKLGIGLAYFALACAVAIPVILGPGKALSRIDEPTHADYAYAISHFEVPARGSYIAPEIRRLWACAGQERYLLPECGDAGQPYQFPYQGRNYNFQHPPLYYAVVGFPARVVADVTGLDFITSARLSGPVWLAAGMYVLFVALRRWRVDPALAIVAPVILLTFPRVLHAATTVNPDAAAPLAGALALWICARYLVDRATPVLWPTVIVGLVGMTKFISVIPFAAFALLMLVRAVRDHKLKVFSWVHLRLPVLMGAAVVIPYVAWAAFQADRGTTWWTNPLVGINTRDVVGLPGSEWVATLFLGFNLASDYYVQKPMNIALLMAWTRLLNVLVIGALFATVVAFAKEPVRRSLGWIYMGGALLYPLAVQVQAYLNTDVPQYFPNPTGRYGLTLIPGTIACLVMAATKAGYRRAVYVLAIVGLIVMGVVIGAGFQRM